MSSFVLKVIALVTMIIDHVGAVFFPEHLWIRYIGRISFPIFAFLLVQGFIHSKNRGQYALRLGGFALLSEIPYDLLFHGKIYEPEYQNIMFELLCGLLVLWCIEKVVSYKKYIFIIPLPILLLASAYFRLSYDVYGIILMVAYYLLRKYPTICGFSGAVVTYGFNGLIDWEFDFLGKSNMILSYNPIQLYAVLASVPLIFYNGKKGKYSLKWFFYIIYPAHLLVL